jgi:hypothetical protein
MSFPKPQLSFWQIINMNVGFFGIQYSFGLKIWFCLQEPVINNVNG